MHEAGLLETTATEAAALSGLPIARCEEALFHLARAYPTRVRVTEAGTLHFTFTRLQKTAPLRGWKATRIWLRKSRPELLRTAVFTLMPFFLVTFSLNAFALPNAVAKELIDWGWMTTLGLTLGVGGLTLALCLLMYRPYIGVPLLIGLFFFPPYLLGAVIALGLAVAAYLGEERLARGRHALTAGAGPGSAKLPGFLTEIANDLKHLDKDGFQALLKRRETRLFVVMITGVGFLGMLAPQSAFGSFALFCFSVLGALILLLFVGFNGRDSLEAAFKRRTSGGLEAFVPIAERWTRTWVTGPEPVDALEDERRLITSIIHHHGVLSVRDLMLLFDWDKEEAESQAPRLLVDYGGELIVTEDGALVLRFQGLGAMNAQPDIDIRPCFERGGPPRLWDCPHSVAACLMLVSGFLLWSLWAHPMLSLFPGPATLKWQFEEDTLLPMFQGLGAWPYLLVFLPPVMRFPAWYGAWSEHRREHGRRVLLGLLARSAEGGPVEGPDHQAIVRLGGDIDIARSVSGTPWVHFPILEVGDREAEALRREVRRDEGTEAVVFDTEA